MKKVLVGGVFDFIHPGHIFFLKKAKELGDLLVVVIASDRTAKRKGAMHEAKWRKFLVENLKMVDKVVIGDEEDWLKVVEKERPDVIALGYDQTMDEGWLREELEKRGLKVEIVRIRENLPEYKTRRIRELLKRMI